MSKRLIFLVEGDTEVMFVNNCIVPYLYARVSAPISIEAHKILTNRRLHKKGGVPNYDKFKVNVDRLLAQPDTLVTTLIDFYALPTNFPNFTMEAARVGHIEQGILHDYDGDARLLPYIQLHEVEALMFSTMDGFKIICDETKELDRFQHIMDEYPNPELINNSPETAPSKRIGNIINYDKVLHSEMVFEMLSIDAIRSKCPRFNAWIDAIISLIAQA